MVIVLIMQPLDLFVDPLYSIPLQELVYCSSTGTMMHDETEQGQEGPPNDHYPENMVSRPP
jgi:hypothetical protein